jgi:hypothetical protein
MGYEVGAAILPACAVGFDHARPRIVFVGDTDCDRQSIMPVDAETRWMPRNGSDAGSVLSSDGIPDRLALAAFGNAIVPQVAAEVIAAYMEITS